MRLWYPSKNSYVQKHQQELGHPLLAAYAPGGVVDEADKETYYEASPSRSWMNTGNITLSPKVETIFSDYSLYWTPLYCSPTTQTLL